MNLGEHVGNLDIGEGSRIVPAMNVFADIITGVSEWMRPYVLQIAVAFVATVLFVYANDINRWVKRRIKRKHFIIRAGIFVMVCAFGYGALTVLAASVFASFLGSLDPLFLAPVVVMAFVAVGIVAERKKQI